MQTFLKNTVMRAKYQNLWRNFIALNNHDKSAVTLWKMKNSIPCSFFEWRNCVNRLNFAQSGFSGKNGGQSGPFAGDPFLQALQNGENKILYKRLSLSGSYVTKPSKVSLQVSSQWLIQTYREGGWRGEGGGGETRGTQSQKKNWGPLASVSSKNKHIKKYMIYFINH